MLNVKEDQPAIKETVETLNRLGYPELIVRSHNEPVMSACRDAVIRELKARRAVAQAPQKNDSASGIAENAIKQVLEKERTWVTATREFHGVVMDPAHVALAWCVFCWSDHFPYCAGADGLTAFHRAFQRASHP